MRGIGAHEVVVETPDHRKGFADLLQSERRARSTPIAIAWTISPATRAFAM